jgi:ParB family transcriptional regulator, chromosome partitioning protein
MSTVSIQPSTEYRNLPLGQLQESPTNPRRRFDEHSLEELADSFHTHGVLQPLLVRAITDERYEVIAGARRYRAAKLAELAEVPVRVVTLSDAECVETQLVENIQREGVHPLEEAFAFHALLHMDGLNYDIQSLAAKAGKSAAFVAQRLRLTELLPSIADAFLADKIGVGHALEIAKLPHSQQERAFEAAFRPVYSGSVQTEVLLPLRDFTAWVGQNILLALDSVPFDKNDATLLPDAGSCAECPKRTGYNTLLFGEVRRDSCSDSACFSAKLGKHIEREIAAKPKLIQISSGWSSRAEGTVLGRGRYVTLSLSAKKNGKEPRSPYQKPCKHMAEAIVVEGTERGQTVKVCAEPNCAVHFADRRTPSPEQIAKEREQRRKALEQQKLETTVRHRVLAEVLKQVSAPLERQSLSLVAMHMLNRLEPLHRESIARRHKMVDGSGSEVSYPMVQKGLFRLLRQLDESGLSKLLIEVALLSAADAHSTEAAEPLMSAAKQYKVDIGKVRKAVEHEFAAKRAKLAAKRKATAKPAPRSAA